MASSGLDPIEFAKALAGATVPLQHGGLDTYDINTGRPAAAKYLREH